MLLERQVAMGLAAHDEVLRAELAVKDAETKRAGLRPPSSRRLFKS